ncbi:hypothetical protein SXCC_02973 [Gluconacetobacter sp. SXCC-1]|nr:hypothetical protein SXCC_02973 [Gluconacetobacter sp. SXCC-1]
MQTEKNPARDVRSAGCLYLAFLILPLLGLGFPDSMPFASWTPPLTRNPFLPGQRDTPHRE